MIHTLDTPYTLDTLGTQAARRWALTSLGDLVAQRPALDRSNVYPVADGDTGTNLVLTLEAGVQKVERTLPRGADLARLGSTFARGALLGARGSSGVILSQWLRGAGDVLGGAGRVGGPALAAALRRAADDAVAAVSRPVEGTMLSIARAAADGARGGTLAEVVTGAAVAARSALARTPDQLAVLSAAGVVDAGGRGLLVLLDALAVVVTGQRPRPSAPETRAAPLVDPVGGGGPTSEVMLVLDAGAGPVGRLRERLGGLGESVVVAGGDGLWSVHVHTHDPDGADAVVDAGRAAGAVRDVRVGRLGAS